VSAPERPLVTEHALKVQRTARYFQLGEMGPATRDLWIVAHGYGQLASRFLTVFDRVAGAECVVVAPEGLSRFYVERSAGERGARKVGASWMTREDRLNEIEDYVAFLDELHDRLVASLDPARVRLTAVGFSQGVATITRWVARGRARVARLIACGGLLPPELDDAAYARLRAVELILVIGRRDDFATPELVAHEESRLREHGVPCRTIWFDGGHEVGRGVIEGLTGGKRGAGSGERSHT
jgi:predicted esterase